MEERARPEPGSEPDCCLTCRAPAPRKLFFQSGKWFWLCTSCELVFVHDIYPEFLEGEEHLNYLEIYGERRELKARERRRFGAVLRTFEDHRQSGRLLEVGCGVGLFLEYANSRGWNASGVELLPELAQHAREDRGLDVRAGELHEAGFPDGEFDVAYMSEVIEHVIDPIELLREVRRVLRPSGVALVGTGNARSWTARLRGEDWKYYQFAGHGHIRYYGPKAAPPLARAAGFASVRSTTRGFALREKEELAGRWYKPLAKAAQVLVSPLLGVFGAGHKLTMEFRSAPGE